MFGTMVKCLGPCPKCSVPAHHSILSGWCVDSTDSDTGYWSWGVALWYFRYVHRVSSYPVKPWGCVLTWMAVRSACSSIR
eukprot:1000565-Rhodomonas_salina.7